MELSKYRRGAEKLEEAGFFAIILDVVEGTSLTADGSEEVSNRDHLVL